MRNFIKYFGPLIFIELYLILTLLIFVFGPVHYQVDNSLIFWFYILLYHASMVLGYTLAILPVGNINPPRIGLKVPTSFEVRVLILLAFIAFLIGHKNISMSDSLFPENFLSDIVSGVVASEVQYILKIERLQTYDGDKLLNFLNFFIAFSKIVLIPILIFFWDRFTVIDKILALIVSFLPVLSGVSTGTNKPLFDFVIIYGVSLFLHFVACFYRGEGWSFKSRRFFVLTIALFFMGALWFFGSAMLGRGGDPSYFESTSPLGHILLDVAYRAVDEVSFFTYTYIWLSYYLVQGYYGFSQSLHVDFTSTFGFGSSQFLMRQFEWLTGYSLLQDTYQYKISSIWGEAQWHSLYSYIANDFHFLGVSVWCFIICFYLAKVWKSFLDEDNLFSKLLLPLFALIIIWMPANNQVFGYLETFSAFLFLSILWFCSLRKRRDVLRG
jgi:hypothetical protein